MRTAILTHPRQFEVRSLDLPDPGEGEVRIRVRGCGVCGSDMGPWKGLQGLTHTFPLSGINRAFAMAEERPDGFLKSVVLAEEVS